MDPIIKYLIDRILLDDPLEAKHLRWTTSQYILMNEHLYKRSFLLRLLKCLGPTDVDYALLEVHEEIYRNHLGGKSLAYKILRQGYYWLTMKKDASKVDVGATNATIILALRTPIDGALIESTATNGKSVW